MEKCKYCGSCELSKNGQTRGKQRYKCKQCKKNQVESDGRSERKYSKAIKHLAVSMYLNCMGFRAIGRVLQVPFQSVHYWIKQAGQKVEDIASQKIEESSTIEILEMDELFTYVQKKSGKFEYGLLLIGTEIKLLRIM